ncbi:MAG: electron transfer flavoprotein subunit beta/FixA family protein [Actinomycetota bacterium]
MRAVVLVKYVPAPQGTPTMGPDHLLVRDAADAALDPGDEFAIEQALRIVEAQGGEVTLVSMGPAQAQAAIRKGLSMGAAKGVLVTDPALRGADVLATARVLAAAVRAEGFDLLLGGVESTDGYTGTLPIAVAELLGVPGLTFARAVTVADGIARVERQTEGGYDVVEAPLPALVTVTGSADEPRYPNLKGIMAAKQKPVEERSLADLGLTAADVAPTQSIAAVREAPGRQAGEIVTAEDGPRRIADLLADAKVLR